MPVHLHTTIPQKTDKILEELAKTYGTKSCVIEKALETFVRVEEIGSCDDCSVKRKTTEQADLRQALELASVERNTLDGLLAVALGDKSFEDYIKEQQVETLNIVAVIKDSIEWRTPTNFKELLLLLEEIKDLTRLFDVSSHNEIDNTIVLRTRVFTKMPEIAAVQIATILEGAGAPFDLRIMGEDIVIKMVRADTFALRKKEIDKILSQQIQRRFEKIKPAIFRNNLALVGPGFFSWAQKYTEEPVTDMGGISEDVRTVIGTSELPKEPRDFLNTLVSASIKMNWFKQAKIVEEDENNLTLVFQAISPAVARVAINAFSVMLATRGWKLLNYNLEHASGRIEVEFVGLGDQSLLDLLTELSAYQTISAQFLDVITVPRTVLNSFASMVFETDKEKFDAVYATAGEQISNAIRILTRDDCEKGQRLAQEFIKKNIHNLQRDAEVKFADKEFTIIFKQMDPILMSSQQTLIESMFKELGYEIAASTSQNIQNYKLKRAEKPILEPVSRKTIMRSLTEAMSAANAKEAFSVVKDQFDKTFPQDYPWTINEVGKRMVDMYRQLDVKVGVEYFEGGFTLKYETCPYHKLVESGQKIWLCEFRRKTIEYIISRVTQGKGGKIKIIKSLLQNEHPCEYAVFLTGFMESS